jgi:hypothetical protein
VIAGVGALDVPIGYAIFMTLGALVFVPLCLRGVRLMWREPMRVFAEPFPWWVWGAPLWRGYVRGLVTVGATFVIDLIAVLALVWLPGGDAVVIAVAPVLLGSIAVGFVLAVTIVLFNRPRRLVPPYLRDQPGAVSDWLASWRRRRRPDTVAR